MLRTALVLGLLVKSVVVHNTLLLDHSSTSSQLSPIHFKNASATIVKTGIAPHSGRSFFTISEMSGLSLVSISIVGDSHIPAIVYGNGHILMDTVVLPSDTSIDTLYQSSGMESTVAVKTSEITDMVYSGSRGTLVSSGLVETQSLTSCIFSNVTRGRTEGINHSRLSLVEECSMGDTVMSDTEDTFYNYIVSGLSPMTADRFGCQNASFLRCWREHDPPRSVVLSYGKENGCTSSTTQSGNTKYQDYTCTSSLTRTELKVTSSGGGGSKTYTVPRDCSFTNCQFSSISSTNQQYGGAIYCEGTSDRTISSLSITSSTFSSCTVSSSNNYYYGYGGAIYCKYVQSLTITESTFTSCTATGYYGAYGGAIYCIGSSNSYIPKLEITSSTFSTCKCTLHGGAIYSQYIQSFSVTNTNFTTCQSTSTGSTEYSGGAIYFSTGGSNGFSVSTSRFEGCTTGSGRGGGIFLTSLSGSSSKVPTISDSVFYNCKATSQRGGGVSILLVSVVSCAFIIVLLYCIG